MSEKLLKTLAETGLTEHEARVYLATLSLGPSTVLKIARESGVKRTTVYSVIESLKQKGLMIIEPRGFKQLYIAEDPTRLESVLESRKQTLQKELPELSALYNLKGGESLIKYYEGLEAVKNVYDGLLEDARRDEDYAVVSNIEGWYSLDPDYFEQFREKRAKRGVKARILLQDSPGAREYKKFERNYNVEIKILPEGTELATNLVVIPRRVVVHQLTPPIMAIVVENKSIIKMHQEFFEIMWNATRDE